MNFQRSLKRWRVVLALFFMLVAGILFLDIRGNLNEWVTKLGLYLQFIPSIIAFISPKAMLSLGFLVILLLTFLYGRVYCSVICPLGILQDVVSFIKKKVKPKSRYKYKKALNYLRYPILALTALSISFSGLVFVNLLDPYANFGRIMTNLVQPIAIVFNNALVWLGSSLGLHWFKPIVSYHAHLPSIIAALTILLVVVFMSTIRGRLYCNSICPVGTLLGLISKVSMNRIRFNKASCTKCGKCQFACKSNCIDVKDMKVDDSRCVACYNCLQVCPTQGIAYENVYKLKKKDSDKGKRDFLRASVFLGLTATGIAKGQGHHGHGHHGHGKGQGAAPCFSEKGVVAPPGALNVDRFKDKCVACHLCVSSCPTKVLQPSFLQYGFSGMLQPHMEYTTNFCNYECTHCGDVCPTGAILPLDVEEKKLTKVGEAKFIRRLCIVKSEGTDCGACSEHCPTQAVKMVPYRDHLTIPEVDGSICIGCGACEYACPVTDPHRAIFVKAYESHELAESPIEDKVEFEETEDFPF